MRTDPFRLDGKVAVVTGSGTGIGQAVAIGLAEAGAAVAGVYHIHSPDETLLKVSQAGGNFYAIQADLSGGESVARIVQETVSALGRVDILVNNAGIIRRNEALEFNEQEWDSVMNVNLKSLFFLSQAAARQMLAQRSGGKIINIASMLSFQGGIRVASYTASKSAVLGLTRLLANEWARHSINVNAIAPGYIETNNTLVLRQDEKRNAEILGRIPAGRWGQPEDLVGAAVFLASDASKYVHGFTLAVDGGWLAR